MEEKMVFRYLRGQIKQMVGSESAAPTRVRAFFGNSTPRDKEILGLLALSTMRPEFPLRHRFATPLEAVACLPVETRAVLCREFRECVYGGAPVAALLSGVVARS